VKYVWLVPFLFLFGCQHRPIQELVLADVAVKAAAKVKADALAPDMYRKAENTYLRAKRDFEEGYYDSCRKFADEARILAEKAEYQAIFKQSRIRGSSPEEAEAGGEN
jgi:hypothetical protein